MVANASAQEDQHGSAAANAYQSSQALAAHARQARARYTVQVRGHCKEKRVSALTELALQVLEVQSEVEDVCSQKLGLTVQSLEFLHMKLNEDVPKQTRARTLAHIS